MNSRAQKTRDHIKEVFMEMLCEMPLRSITVSGISERAHIHRKTFYLHYEYIEELYEEVIQDILKSYYEEIRNLSVPFTVQEMNHVFFEWVRNTGKAAETIICDEGCSPLFDRVFQLSHTHNRTVYDPYSHLPEGKKEIVDDLLKENTLFCYRKWVQSGKRFPMEELIELIDQVTEKGIASFFRESDSL